MDPKSDASARPETARSLLPSQDEEALPSDAETGSADDVALRRRPPMRAGWFIVGASVASSLALATLWALSSRGVGTPIGPDSPTAPALAEICERASTSIERGDPAAARDLIEALREPALERIAAGSPSAGDSALAAACEPEWNAALIGDEASTPVNDFGDSWDWWYTGYVEPLAGPTAWLLGWLGATILVARLLTIRSRSPWMKSTRTRRAVWGTLGVGLAIVTPALWIIAAQNNRFETLPLIGVVGTAACIPFAMWLGGRTRLTVRVKDAAGSASESASAVLASYIRDIGGSTPKGIEIASGTDLTQLTDAASALSSSKAMTFLMGAVDVLLNITPWKVEATQVNDATIVVSISRNGRPIDLQRVDISKPPLGFGKETGGEVALRMVAARVVVALTKEHPDVTGLYGATRPTSVGYYYLATTTFESDRQRKLHLLQHAVGADQKNLLARSALQIVDVDAALVGQPELADLAEFVNRASELCGEEFALGNRERTGEEPKYREPNLLKLRLLTRYVAVFRNWLARSDRDTIPNNSWSDLASVLYELVLRLAERDDQDDPDGLISVMRKRAAFSSRLLVRQYGLRNSVDDAVAEKLMSCGDRSRSWLKGARKSTDPDVQYDLACYLAQVGKLESDSGRDSELYETAVRLLKASIHQDDEGAEEAWGDPELAPLRAWESRTSDERGPSRDGFRALTRSKTYRQFWQIPPLANVAARLAQAGVTTVHELASSRPSDGLQEHLGISDAEYRHLKETAELGRRLEQHTPLRHRAPEILGLLVAMKLDTSAKVRAERSRDRASLERYLMRGLDSIEPPPTATEVFSLVGSL